MYISSSLDWSDQLCKFVNFDVTRMKERNDTNASCHTLNSELRCDRIKTQQGIGDQSKGVTLLVESLDTNINI